MISITEIKRALIVVLKKVRDIDVYFEEIAKTDDEPAIDDYFFVSLIPVNTTLAGEIFRKRTLFVSIAYYHNTESNHHYLETYQKITEEFMPVFHFADRHITIDAVDMKISDCVAHYSFTLNFIDKTVEEINGDMSGDIDFEI